MIGALKIGNSIDLVLLRNGEETACANQLKIDKENDQLALFDLRTHLRVASKKCVAGRPLMRTCA